MDGAVATKEMYRTGRGGWGELSGGRVGDRPSIGTMDFMPVKDNSTAGIVAKHIRMPFVHTDDIGAIARITFETPQKCIGQEIAPVGDFFTGAELAAEVCGLKNKPKYKYKCPPTFVFGLVSRLGLTRRVLPHAPDLHGLGNSAAPAEHPGCDRGHRRNPRRPRDHAEVPAGLPAAVVVEGQLHAERESALLKGKPSACRSGCR